MNNPPTFTVTPTSTKGQSLFQWNEAGNPRITGLHSLQMPTEIAQHLASLAFSMEQLNGLVSTLEADIRSAQSNEAHYAAYNLHGTALEWKSKADGLMDARIRVLALIQSVKR